MESPYPEFREYDFARQLAARALPEDVYEHAVRIRELVVPDYEAMAVAMLHDVVKDTKIELPSITALFSMPVARAVGVLTRWWDTEGHPAETYAQHIRRIKESRNELALKVKLAELEDALRQEETLQPEQERHFRKALGVLKA